MEKWMPSTQAATYQPNIWQYNQPVFHKINTRLVVFIQFHITNSQNKLNPTLTHKGKDRESNYPRSYTEDSGNLPLTMCDS